MSHPEDRLTLANAPTRALGRRGLIAGGGAVLGSLAAGSLTSRACAATIQGTLPASVDVVVIGAGLAGLVAARDVAASGRSVLVVEARDRVGGRVLNHHLATGGTIESGGAFIGPTQDRIKALADEFGVETFDEYVSGKNVYLSSLLGRSLYKGTVPPDPTILLDAALLQLRLDAMASKIDVNAPWRHPQAARWDAITLEQWIRRSTLNSWGILNLLRSWTQPTFGADPDELSFLFALHYIACSGNEMTKGTFERSSDTVDGAQESRFVGGSQRVPLALAQVLGDRIALAAPVTKIEHVGAKVRVHTVRGPVEARRVIVAAPPKQVLDIDFAPGIPVGRRTLLEKMQMGRLMKADAVYEVPFWREAGLTGFGIADKGAVRVAFDNGASDTDHGILLAFVGGSTLEKYGALPRAERRTAVLEGFAAMFGKQALSPIEYVEQDWTKERWTGGGPTAILGTGVLSRLGQHLRTPYGRVHWAGTETSTHWTGYMDGAVRSGERAAVEVLAAL